MDAGQWRSPGPVPPRRDVRQRLDIWLEMFAAFFAAAAIWLFFGGAAGVYLWLLLRMLSS